MDNLTPSVFYFLVFSPLIASIFITLIPTNDADSKNILSRFFSFSILSIYACLFVLLKENNFQDNFAYLVKIGKAELLIDLHANIFSLFLIGTAVFLLNFYYFMYKSKDLKTNIHEVAPFLLTFIFFLASTQKDIRLAFALLSVSLFIIFFLISYSSQPYRGSAIFQSGIFLFTTDALALVLLQDQFFPKPPAELTSLVLFLCCIPGLARLFLPMCAPFMSIFFRNIDPKEGPFILAFMQLSGFSLLFFINNIAPINYNFVLLINLISAISVLHLALLSIHDKKSRLLYYYSIFYGTVAVVTLFYSPTQITKYFAIALLFSGLSTFVSANKIISFFTNAKNSSSPKTMRSFSYLAFMIIVGIPGIGIGVILWPAILYLTTAQGPYNSWSKIWFLIILLWIISYLLLSYASAIALRSMPAHKTEKFPTSYHPETRLPLKIFLLPILVCLWCTLITAGVISVIYL